MTSKLKETLKAEIDRVIFIKNITTKRNKVKTVFKTEKVMIDKHLKASSNKLNSGFPSEYEYVGVNCLNDINELLQ